MKFGKCYGLFLLIIWASALTRSEAGGVITNATEAALRFAMRTGGTVTINADGILSLTNTVVVATSTVLDATGHALAISGGGNVRLFVVNPGVSLTIRNIGLLSGKQSSTNTNNGGIASPDGGGIYNNGGLLMVFDSSISSHTVRGLDGASPAGTDDQGNGLEGGAGENARGGAIFNNAGTILLSNCVLNANSAVGGKGGTGSNASNAGNGREGGDGGIGGAGAGGAIYNRAGNIIIFNSSFGTNAVASSVGGVGGTGTGFFGFNGHARATGDAAGAGIYNDQGILRVVNSTFLGNASTGGGGAAASAGVNSQEGDDGIAGGAGIGGGIASRGGTINMTNSTFYANSVIGGGGGSGGQGGSSGFGGDGGNGGPGGAGLGGAIYTSADTISSVASCTFSDNSAQAGLGGVAGAAGNDLSRAGSGGSAGLSSGGAIYNDANLSLINTILNASASGGNLGGRVTDLGSNISSDGSITLSGPGSMIRKDPLLNLIGQNGGPTQTMPITTNSPAANAAIESACLPRDQRGYTRFGRCDIGAFEAKGTLPLSILLVSTNNLLLRWFGFNVETSTNIVSTNWTPITPTLANGVQSYTIQVSTNSRAFFRQPAN